MFLPHRDLDFVPQRCWELAGICKYKSCIKEAFHSNYYYNNCLDALLGLSTSAADYSQAYLTVCSFPVPTASDLIKSPSLGTQVFHEF